MSARRHLLPAALLLAWAFVPVAVHAQEPVPEAEADEAMAAHGFAGSETCLECHEFEQAQFEPTKMGRLFLNHPRNALEELGCESCHGPSLQHAETGGDERGEMISFTRRDPTPVDRRNDMCLTCHEESARVFWTGSPHESRDVGCADCHQVHKVPEVVPAGSQFTTTGVQLKGGGVMTTCAQCHMRQTTQQLRFSHMPLPEGKMDCASCHNPHGSPTEKLLRGASVNDTCFTCHTEKRGPFLWEHAPVVESCSNCHDPHGSNHEKMLLVSKPRLCQQCHVEPRHPSNPQTPNATRFVMGRQCSNCHVSVHGSNHPSAIRFTR